MAVVLLMGMPGSGKSTFANHFHDKCSHAKITSTLIRFDDIDNESVWDETTFSRQRNENLKTIEDWIIRNKDPLDEFGLTTPILIIDDLMYLRSMRRKIYVMARNNGLPLLVVWIKTTLETALMRNNLRIGREKIDVDTIRKIDQALQPPDRNFIFDRNNIVVENDSVSIPVDNSKDELIRLNSNIQNVIEYINTLVNNAAHTHHLYKKMTLSNKSPAEDTDIILPKQAKDSIMKDIDLSIRELTTIAMKRLVSQLSTAATKLIGVSFAKTKAETLSFIRQRSISLPDQEIANFKIDILKFYSEYFIHSVERKFSSCNNYNTSNSTLLDSIETKECINECIDYMYAYIADKYSE